LPASLPCTGSAVPSSFEGLVGNTRGYDDSWSSTQMWRSIGNLSSIINASSESDAPVFVQPMTTHHQPQQLGPEQGSDSSDSTSSSGGACYASCPPMMGFGTCFNMPADTPAGNCSSIVHFAGAVCPAHGNPRQCQSPPIPLDTDCSTIVLNGKPNCTLVSNGCEQMPGGGVGGLLPSNPTYRFATCMCHPTRFEEKQLSWTSNSCVYTPFYPPPPVGITNLDV
jgi:hypothetical protein